MQIVATIAVAIGITVSSQAFWAIDLIATFGRVTRTETNVALETKIKECKNDNPRLGANEPKADNANKAAVPNEMIKIKVGNRAKSCSRSIG